MVFEDKKLQKAIIFWSEKNSLRNFPWRNTVDPYEIMLTEIMLRRTKAENVNKIWGDFFGMYYDEATFLRANDEQIKMKLETLGLVKHRIEAMREVAKYLFQGGELLRDNLMCIKGVGQYISGMAVIMIKNTKCVVYDSNFRRLFSRFYDIDFGLSLKNNKLLEKYADKIIPDVDPRGFVLSLLDFTAMVCKPKNPLCEECNLKKDCAYYINSNKNI